jgi:hypothetical protein
MKPKIPHILKVVIFILLPVSFRAQSGKVLSEFSDRKYNTNHSGMAVLTCWSSVNIVGGTAGYFISGDKKEKSFYGMNAIWGLVNFGIALPGFLGKKPTYNSKKEALKDQKKTERIFLINAGLDVIYIGGGFALNQIAMDQSDIDKKAVYSGFGESIIMQGGALLIFDVAMFSLNKKNRKKHLQPILDNAEISFNPKGFSLKYSF